jgi:hypothetical protein
MSGFGDEAEILCSAGALPVLTHLGHEAPLLAAMHGAEPAPRPAILAATLIAYLSNPTNPIVADATNVTLRALQIDDCRKNLTSDHAGD